MILFSESCAKNTLIERKTTFLLGVVEGPCGLGTLSFSVFNVLSFRYGEKFPMNFRCPRFSKTSRQLEPCEHIPRLNCSWSCWIKCDYCLIVIETNFWTARERPTNCFWKNSSRVRKICRCQGSNSLWIIKALKNLSATYDLFVLNSIFFQHMWWCRNLELPKNCCDDEMMIVFGTSTSELENLFYMTRSKTIDSKCSWNPNPHLDSVNGKRMACYFNCFFSKIQLILWSLCLVSDAFCATKKHWELKATLARIL